MRSLKKFLMWEEILIKEPRKAVEMGHPLKALLLFQKAWFQNSHGHSTLYSPITGVSDSCFWSHGHPTHVVHRQGRQDTYTYKILKLRLLILNCKGPKKIRSELSEDQRKKRKAKGSTNSKSKEIWSRLISKQAIPE